MTVYVCQFDGHMLCLLQGVTAEEIGRVIILAQECPFALFHHGSKLAEVTDHEQLHSSEGAMAVFVEAQHCINLVEEVGTHHRYLINNEKVERTDNILLLLTEAVLLILRIERATRDIGCQRELKKRVYGDTTGIDSRHARGRYHHHALGRTLLETAQKGGLTRTCLAREEDVYSRALHQLPREVQLLVAMFFFHTSISYCLRVDNFFSPRRQNFFYAEIKYCHRGEKNLSLCTNKDNG